MDTTKEYWYVEFNERFANIYEWTQKAICIARHPSKWIRCKREFNDEISKMNGDVRTLWEITKATQISKEDYDIFMEENI